MPPEITPLRWNNVNAPNQAAALDALNRSGQQFGTAIQGIGGAISDGANQYADSQTDAFITELNAAPDDATRQQMVADASQAFLHMDQVNTAVTDAQNQDFAVAAEGRDVTRANQETKLFNQTFNQTERTNPHYVSLLEDRVTKSAIDVQIAEKYGIKNADLINKIKIAEEKVATATTDEAIATAEQNLTKLTDSIKHANNRDTRAGNADKRQNTAASEQTTRFQQQTKLFRQSQDVRDRTLKQEEFVNEELAATTDRIRFPTTADRYKHLQGIIQNARANNMTLTPAQESKISKDMARAASRLRPTDVGVQLPRYTTAFTALANRPQLLPNGQQAVDANGQPITQDPTASEVASFARNVAQEIATANPELAEADVERLAKETMAEMPQFAKIAITANLKDQILKGAGKAAVDEAVKSASWNARVEEAPNRTGLQGIIREFMRKEGGAAFDADAIDDEDLNIDIQSVWNKIDTIMPEYKTDAEIAKAVMRLVGASHVDKSWVGYSDVQFRSKSDSWDWMDLDTKSKEKELRDYLLSK